MCESHLFPPCCLVEGCSVNDLGARLQEMKDKEDIFLFFIKCLWIRCLKSTHKIYFLKDNEMWKSCQPLFKNPAWKGKEEMMWASGYWDEASVDLHLGRMMKVLWRLQTTGSFCLLVCLVSLLISLFLAALGLCCCMQTFSSCSEQGLLFVSMCRLFIVMASLDAEHGL